MPPQQLAYFIYREPADVGVRATHLDNEALRLALHGVSAGLVVRFVAVEIVVELGRRKRTELDRRASQQLLRVARGGTQHNRREYLVRASGECLQHAPCVG